MRRSSGLYIHLWTHTRYTQRKNELEKLNTFVKIERLLDFIVKHIGRWSREFLRILDFFLSSHIIGGAGAVGTNSQLWLWSQTCNGEVNTRFLPTHPCLLCLEATISLEPISSAISARVLSFPTTGCGFSAQLWANQHHVCENHHCLPSHLSSPQWGQLMFKSRE